MTVSLKFSITEPSPGNKYNRRSDQAGSGWCENDGQKLHPCRKGRVFNLVACPLMTKGRVIDFHETILQGDIILHNDTNILNFQDFMDYAAYKSGKSA